MIRISSLPCPKAAPPPLLLNLLLIGVLISSLTVASGGSESAALAARAREIQNTCFALYPPDLLQRMTSGEIPPPPEVLADPALQEEYLSTEDVVAKGLFYPALLEDLLPALQERAAAGERFLDLGSGDGRVVFLAALVGAEATGIEYDRTLHRLARQCLKRLAPILPTDRIKLRRGDFFKEDLGRYDVIFYYVHGSFAEDRLKEKLRREMRDDALLLLYRPRGPFPGMVHVADHGHVQAFRRAR